MALTVTHTTPSDLTFSASGAAAWDASHTVTGTADGGVPIGGIIMWSGTIATIPATWALCDGTANAPGPDLRDKFVVGAKQDDAGVAKTNIAGALSQSGGATGHLHSAHADLVHAGITIGDHTGLTHALAIANHPDLTHAALSHAAQTFSHADHAVASVTHTHAAVTVTPADHSVASFTGTHASATGSVPSGTLTIASQAGVASFASGTNRSGLVSKISQSGSVASATFTVASGTHTHAAVTLTHAGVGIPSITGSHAGTTLTHADHSFPSLSHQAIGTHVGTDYGVHGITQPNDHGVAGTLTHSFSQPNNHVLSLHDTVSNLPSYFSLAFMQRMS
jgi:hypothetical protein